MNEKINVTSENRDETFKMRYSLFDIQLPSIPEICEIL